MTCVDTHLWLGGGHQVPNTAGTPSYPTSFLGGVITLLLPVRGACQCWAFICPQNPSAPSLHLALLGSTSWGYFSHGIQGPLSHPSLSRYPQTRPVCHKCPTSPVSPSHWSPQEAETTPASFIAVILCLAQGLVHSLPSRCKALLQSFCPFSVLVTPIPGPPPSCSLPPIHL